MLDRTVSRGVSVSTVTLDHVCKVYERGSVTVSVLRDADLHVASGEFCVIMGPSGSGKSTLLNVIAGLDSVTSGAIRLDDQPTDRFSDAEWTRYRRETIGMVFQAFHLVPGLTAAENVGLPLRLQKTSSAFIRQRVGETLERVGVQHRAGHRPWELSGGEQQRVALARALVHQPRILLADEPTGNLDSQTAKEIVALIRHVSKEEAQTVIFVTHSESAARVGDHVYELDGGQLHQSSMARVPGAT